MVVSKYARRNGAAEVFQRLAVLVVEVALCVAVPNPVAQREHTFEFEPFYWTVCEVHLHAHVACVYALHIERVAVACVFARSDFAAAGRCLVFPVCVVGVGYEREYRIVESVADFIRNYFLVYGVRVDCVALGRCQERAA